MSTLERHSRPARTALDALHAELLGTLLEICQKADSMKKELPEVKGEVEQLVHNVHSAFAELRDSSISLVGYVKHKQTETLQQFDAAHTRTQRTFKRALSGYDRLFWMLAALGVVNTLLLLAVISKLLIAP